MGSIADDTPRKTWAEDGEENVSMNEHQHGQWMKE
jgi:hypothetical protein